MFLAYSKPNNLAPLPKAFNSDIIVFLKSLLFNKSEN